MPSIWVNGSPFRQSFPLAQILQQALGRSACALGSVTLAYVREPRIVAF